MPARLGILLSTVAWVLLAAPAEATPARRGTRAHVQRSSPHHAAQAGSRSPARAERSKRGKAKFRPRRKLSAEELKKVGDPCEKLVDLTVERASTSGIVELQARAAADRLARRILTDLKLEPDWREGTPHWEEAYQTLFPDLCDEERASRVQELMRARAELPRFLRADECDRYLALIESQPGALALRVKEAQDTAQFLDAYVKAFPVPDRLRPWEEKVRREIDAGLATRQQPDFKASEPLCTRAAQDLAAFDVRYAQAERWVAPAQEPAPQEKRSPGASVLQRLAWRIREIVARFRAAHRPAG